VVQNIKRDPFEQALGIEQQAALSIGGAIGGPVTALQYDFNLLPIGQLLCTWSGTKSSRCCRRLQATSSARSIRR
jgi:hypothetical protein